MSKSLIKCSAILLIVFGLSVAPALGIQATVNTKGITATTNCDLENSAQFYEKSVGGSGTLYQKAQMSGTGENFMEKRTSGYGYEVMGAFRASGAVNSYIATVANADGAAMNSQTGISGGVGQIASSSLTGANYMGVNGGFKGEGGYLSSDITSAAFNGKRAYTGGSASMLGVQCLDEEISHGLAAESDLGMTLSGIYAASEGDIGDFGLVATNKAKNKVEADSTLWYNYEDDESSYVDPLGWKWSDEDKILFYVRNDRKMHDEGLADGDVLSSIESAAQTWEENTTQTLFESRFVLDASKKVDKRDNYNVVGWKQLPSEALAWSRTYYSTKVSVGDYDKALESDISYNTAVKWTTNESYDRLYTYDPGTGPENDTSVGDTFDVETIALHELGHTLGLGDTYLDPVLKYDLAQIMSYYDALQRDIGNGDRNIIQQLYGDPTQP